MGAAFTGDPNKAVRSICPDKIKIYFQIGMVMPQGPVCNKTHFQLNRSFHHLLLRMFLHSGWWFISDYRIVYCRFLPPWPWVPFYIFFLFGAVTFRTAPKTRSLLIWYVQRKKAYCSLSFSSGWSADNNESMSMSQHDTTDLPDLIIILSRRVIQSIAREHKALSKPKGQGRILVWKTKWY